VKVSFFTIVLNGMPFLPYLIESLIDVAHEWFFIEGAVLPQHCTNHCNMPPAWSYDPKTFLSTDGTTQLLDRYEKDNKKIKIIRKYNWWDGKIEMCNSFLDQISGDLLWEVDSDEFWKKEDVLKTVELIRSTPETTCVRFYAKYFVGNTNTVVDETGLGNASWDWFRAWPWKKGYIFTAHEPPTLVLRKKIGPFFKAYDLKKMNLIDREDTKSQDIFLYHYAYVAESQIKFKEAFYPNFQHFYTQWLKMKKDLEDHIYKRVEDYWGQYGNYFKGQLLEYKGDHPLKNVSIR